jgi:hypothetical protein
MCHMQYVRATDIAGCRSLRKACVVQRQPCARTRGYAWHSQLDNARQAHFACVACIAFAALDMRAFVHRPLRTASGLSCQSPMCPCPCPCPSAVRHDAPSLTITRHRCALSIRTYDCAHCAKYTSSARNHRARAFMMLRRVTAARRRTCYVSFLLCHLTSMSVIYVILCILYAHVCHLCHCMIIIRRCMSSMSSYLYYMPMYAYDDIHRHMIYNDVDDIH